MTPASKDTRQQITHAAVKAFRQYGYAKTTVSDIAKACHMSPANIYRFFPSKDAIIEEMAGTVVREMDAAIQKILARPLTASERLEAFTLEMLRYNRKELVEDANMYELVVVCMENHRTVITEHLERVIALLTEVVRQGIASGEFTVADPRAAAEAVFNSLCMFHHPLMLAKHLNPALEDQARQVIGLLCRGLRSPERAPRLS